MLCEYAQDEAIAKMNVDKLRKLKPFFRPQGGSITGGQARRLGKQPFVLGSRSRQLGVQWCA